MSRQTASRTEADGVLTIILSGEPLGKPRWQKSDKWKPRPCIIDYRAFCDYLRLVAKPIPPAGSVTEILVKATFEMAPSWSKKKRAAMLGKQHRQTPDFDNVLKAVVDALWPTSKKVATGGEGDDSAIAAGRIGKWWAEESYLEIKIRLEKP